MGFVPLPLPDMRKSWAENFASMCAEHKRRQHIRAVGLAVMSAVTAVFVLVIVFGLIR